MDCIRVVRESSEGNMMLDYDVGILISNTTSKVIIIGNIKRTPRYIVDHLPCYIRHLVVSGGSRYYILTARDSLLQ